MTVRIGDTVPAPRRRDDERPAEHADTARTTRAALRKQRFAWLSHLDAALHKRHA